MGFVVSARWRAAEGAADEVRDAILRLAGPSRQEPGNRYYQACQDPSEPRVFVIFEIYDDEPAFQAHLASDHFRELGVGTAIPLLDDRIVAFYQTID